MQILIDKFVIKPLEPSVQFMLPFGWLSLTLYPFFFFLYYKTEILWLNSLGTLLGAILLLAYHSVFIKKQYLIFVWLVYLVFNLPFNFTYGLLHNPGNEAYQLAEMLMLVGITIIVSNIAMLIVILVLGISVALVIYGISLAEAIMVLKLNNLGPIYLLGLVFGVVFMQRKTRVEQIKFITAATSSYQISHEINAQLYKIIHLTEMLGIYVPRLVKQYKLYSGKTNDDLITDFTLDSLKKAPAIILKHAERADTIIKIILMNIRSPEKFAEKYTKISMYHCIEQAIQRYPIENEFNMEILDWQKTEDFSFYGVEILMIHVFLNLIRNALTAIEKSQKGHIVIYNRTEGNVNTLYFKDTASGIKRKELNNLFQYNYTQTPQGTGLGLYFCKTVIEAFHGKIQCESIYGKYTEFIIQLPMNIDA